MTVEKFIGFIEDLYGKYSDGWKVWIPKYFSFWKEQDIDDLFQFLIIRHKFNNPPNLAAIEDARREFCERYDKSLGKDWQNVKDEIRQAEKQREREAVEAEKSKEDTMSQEEADKYFVAIKERLNVNKGI